MTQTKNMAHRRYTLPDKELLAVEKEMDAKRIQPREFYYVSSDLIVNWILASRHTKIYDSVLKMHTEWERSISAPVRMAGRYTHPETGKQEIVTDIYNPPKRFLGWLSRFSLDHLEEHLEPIFPPLPEHDLNDFRRLVLATPDRYVDRYAGIKAFSNRVVEWFLSPPKEMAHPDRRFSHLLSRWDYRIIEWIEEEEPAILTNALYIPLSRTRHQNNILLGKQKLTSGIYTHPDSGEEVAYLGGQRPTRLQAWVDEWGVQTVSMWKASID